MSCAVLIPSLGAPCLARCLAAVASLDPSPDEVTVVLSGPGAASVDPPGCEVHRSPSQLGFAAAVNRGLAHLADRFEQVALLNDDAAPGPGWLGTLQLAMAEEDRLAAVQGTVTTPAGELVDGRGITLDRWGLPVQVDRGLAALPEPGEPRRLLAASGTAVLLRAEALEAVRMADGTVLDERFGSFHEDLDLGLRLGRFGWTSVWVPGAPCAHLGSASAVRMPWRHPWWVLTNRWRALAGNMVAGALLRALPRLVRGELRAVRTLARDNPRAVLVAPAAATAVPVLLASGLRRVTPGDRLAALPGAGV